MQHIFFNLESGSTLGRTHSCKGRPATITDPLILGPRHHHWTHRHTSYLSFFYTGKIFGE